MAIPSPEAACAQARVQPHSSPYIRMPRGTMLSMGMENFRVEHLMALPRHRGTAAPGTAARAALPRSARSAGVTRASEVSSWYRNVVRAEPPP